MKNNPYLLAALSLFVSALVTAEEPAPAAALDKEAVEQVQGLVVTATIKQSIGNWNSHGRPEIGDTFEFDLGNLPQKIMHFSHAPPREGKSYIPLSAPLKIERVYTGKGSGSPPRTSIQLSADNETSKLHIRIIADGLEKGSKLRMYLFHEGGFIGSMAEAEGTFKK